MAAVYFVFHLRQEGEEICQLIDIILSARTTAPRIFGERTLIMRFPFFLFNFGTKREIAAIVSEPMKCLSRAE